MFSELPKSPDAFYTDILVQSVIALKLNTYLDNYDSVRFGADGVDRSKEFNGGQSAFFFDWFFKTHQALYAAYEQLEDEASKRLYLHLIAFRLAGHFSVKLPVDFLNKTAEFADFEALATSTPSQMPGGSLFGKLKHYDFDYQDQRYRVDCFGLEYYLVRRQYFYDKGGVRIAPEPGDVVIDGGACTGDTAAVFSNAVGAQGKVFCFDPVAEHVAVLDYNARQFPHANVQVMPFGIGEKNVDAEPIKLDHFAPGFNSASAVVPLRSLDVLVHQKQLPAPSYIKLDVEGAELDSLKGARESIRRHKPKLAVSLYHKPNDLFELILYVKQNFPFYACHIDHYTIHMEETVLYCRPR